MHQLRREMACIIKVACCAEKTLERSTKCSKNVMSSSCAKKCQISLRSLLRIQQTFIRYSSKPVGLLYHFMPRVSYPLQSISSHHLTTSVASSVPSAPGMLLRHRIRLPHLDRLVASGQPQTQPEADNKSNSRQCWHLLAGDNRSGLLSGSATGLAENLSGSDCSSLEGAHGRNLVGHYIAVVGQGPSPASSLSGVVGRH